MRVEYESNSPDSVDGRRFGECVGYVHVAAAPQPGPIGVRSLPEALPNIWAVIIDDKTMIHVAMPIWKVKGVRS